MGVEDLIDGSGELRDSIDGEDAYLEVAATKNFNPRRDRYFHQARWVEFGQATSLAFKFVWRL